MAIVLSRKGSQTPPSNEEEDLLHRSSKKIKNADALSVEEWPMLGDARKSKWVAGTSFADKLQGISGSKEGNPDEDYRNALTGGPWMLFNHYLTVRPWEPSADTCAVESEKQKTGDNSCEEGGISVMVSENANSKEQGVWKVVQKPKRQKHGGKDHHTGNLKTQKSGSRFSALAEESPATVETEKQLEVEQTATKVTLGAEETDKVGMVGDRLTLSGRRSGAPSGINKRGEKSKETVRENKMEAVLRSNQRKEKRHRERNLKSLVSTDGDNTSYEVKEYDRGAEQEKTGKELVLSSPSCSNEPDIEMVLGQNLDPGDSNANIGLAGRFWAQPDDPDPDVDMVPGTVLEGNEMQKTKCESVDRLRCVSKLGFDGLTQVPSVGRSGGLLAAWKSSLIEVEVLHLDRQLIHLRCRFPNDQWFCVTAVYAIPDHVHKQVLWNSLLNFASTMAYPWTVIGDFNDIACSEERTGGLSRTESRFSLFSDRMRSCNLMDLGAVGPKFTWKGPMLNNGY
ncbi:hypothetical protein K1719_021239 [Acacia pycnantha]|nr:hypothetical protein K1719_021239 [Acacia pycnantha]